MVYKPQNGVRKYVDTSDVNKVRGEVAYYMCYLADLGEPIEDVHMMVDEIYADIAANKEEE